MFTIRKATTADCGLIHDMASIDHFSGTNGVHDGLDVLSR